MTPLPFCLWRSCVRARVLGAGSWDSLARLRVSGGSHLAWAV